MKFSCGSAALSSRIGISTNRGEVSPLPKVTRVVVGLKSCPECAEPPLVRTVALISPRDPPVRVTSAVGNPVGLGDRVRATAQLQLARVRGSVPRDRSRPAVASPSARGNAWLAERLAGLGLFSSARLDMLGVVDEAPATVDSPAAIVGRLDSRVT